MIKKTSKAIKNPSKTYDSLRKKKSEYLGYKELIKMTDNQEGWTKPNVPLNEILESIPKEKPTSFIKKMLVNQGYPCIKLWMGTPINSPGRFELNVQFRDFEQATRFKTQYCEPTTKYSPDRKTLQLNPAETASFLEKAKITHQGSNNPMPIMDALRNEHRQNNSLNPHRFNAYKPGLITEKLINTLNTLAKAEPSFFQQELMKYLAELPASDPSLKLSQMKKFSVKFSENNTVEKNSPTELLINLITNAKTSSASELIEQMNLALEQQTCKHKPSQG